MEAQPSRQVQIGLAMMDLVDVPENRELMEKPVGRVGNKIENYDPNDNSDNERYGNVAENAMPGYTGGEQDCAKTKN